ncbi:MAG TPA: hypothetical protein VHF27_08785 [Acidimicrobiales bacterium]|nr:hypothetical protein [Acidimicrobiales bacterium]
MRRVRCRKAVAGFATAVLLLTACGGGEDSSSPTTAPSTTTTIPPAEVDKQKAPRVVLAAADVPGFTQDPPDTDDDGADVEEAANACLNNDPLLVRLGEDDDPRGASSPDFSRGETASVYSAVTFGENDDQARASIAALGAPSFPGCFSDALADALRREDQTFGDVAVNTAPLSAITAGDQSLGYRSTIRARVAGQAVTFYLDFTFIRSGRGLSVLSGFGFGTPFPEADRSRLATAIAGRMAAP